MKMIENYKYKIILLFISSLIMFKLTILFKYKKIKIALHYYSLKNGGAQRVSALLTNYLSKKKIFALFLFLNKKEKNEYEIPINVKKIYLPLGTSYLKKELIKNRIDIIIYQHYNVDEIRFLNNLKYIKAIMIIHCSFLTWFYLGKYSFIKKLYKEYKNSKYIVSLIPFENDFLFKKWGIKSILLNNIITYDYDNISPSDLSSKTILMIGRGDDKRKRFDLGIKSMKFIVKKIPECKMKIVSKKTKIKNLINLVKELELENNVKFIGYTANPEQYFINASLNILPSSTESFPMVLCETKVYGIPNIITGINYITPAKGGVINIIDDDPKSIAKEAIKILSNEKYRKKLGKEARQSMAAFKNSLTSEKWVELIISVYKGDKYYEKLRENSKKISEIEAISILKTQLKLLKKRNAIYKNMTLYDIIHILQ
jgi:glycosyltransferase involved in cell wall biosynthesis